MGEKKQPVYDESKIKTLSSLEHIRLRSGMYIGRLGNGKDPDDGIYVLLKEVIDNSVDEFIMGQGRRILISRDGRRIKVRDFARQGGGMRFGYPSVSESGPGGGGHAASPENNTIRKIRILFFIRIRS